MALSVSTVSTTALITILLFLLLDSTASYGGSRNLPQSDINLLEFPLNLEYLEAEFFSWAALGHGLDEFAPNLTKCGPPPFGAKKANLSPLINDIIAQFALQEFGHIRAIQKTVPGFPRPLLNLSAATFATIMNRAFGKPLVPPFDPYEDDIKYLIACYVVPYVGQNGYVGAIPKLKSPTARKLVAGLLAVESGQDAVIRTLLYERAFLKVFPYDITVAEFTDRISNLRNKLGKDGLKDEGLIVNTALGAEGKIPGNILSADQYSLAYARTPEEILRIVYGTGREDKPGGFYPKGGNGKIARSFLQRGVSDWN